MEDIAALIEAYSRPTTGLVLNAHQYESNTSHFGGKPFASAESAGWPICTKCKYGMIFICQLALTSEQQAQFGLEALVQLFCCPRCHYIGKMAAGTFEVRQSNNTNQAEFKELAVKHGAKRSPVYKWLANVRFEVEEFGVDYGACFNSMPDPYEIAELLKRTKDPQLKVFAPDARAYAESKEYESAIEARGMTTVSGEMQLGGYPCWQQAEGPQLCSQCKEPMELFLQIDGEKCWIGTDGFALLLHCKNDFNIFALIISGT